MTAIGPGAVGRLLSDPVCEADLQSAGCHVSRVVLSNFSLVALLRSSVVLRF